jgi:hypothetical protein
MKKLNATILILFVLVIQAAAQSQKPDADDGTILFGRDYAFILTEPSGWVIDSTTAKSQDLAAVMYPSGSSWKNAASVMYARVVYKDEAQPTIEKVISADVEDFLKQSTESKASDSPSIQTRDKKQGSVKAFYDGQNKNHERVAFIDESKVVVILALSSRNKDEYEKSLPAFKSLVGSYFFLTALLKPAVK